MSDIVLTTFNARFAHASLGLRCLLANLGPWRERAEIVEFDLEKRPEEAVEALLTGDPGIVGCGVYVWNTELVTRTATLLKRIRPAVVLILGGPEVGHALAEHPLSRLADHLIVGEGEEAFRELCGRILAGQPPADKEIIAPRPDLGQLQLPYPHYQERDLAHRQLYVESSRGCPYRCVFCLSSLDEKVRRFPLEPFLAAMQSLLERGGRRFKFVDRSFNLLEHHAVAILDFFLQRVAFGVFLHFEMLPDRLPDAIRRRLAAFPPGVVQLEIGIQSFNPEVLALTQRHQECDLVAENLTWLLTATHAHLHTDLIVGLPGENLESFAAGFDRLVSLGPHEIQVGILKQLAGTPLVAMSRKYGMIFNSEPPYELLANDLIDFFTMRRLKRFARYWDLVGNSGRFPATLALVFSQGSPFATFLRFCDWLFTSTHQTHQIALPRLTTLVREGFSIPGVVDDEALRAAVAADTRATIPVGPQTSATPPRQQRANQGSR
ncbi:MAG: B12-binding domain-containing radical SAM protein [Magnetococcales bacterium]|nr:B12-binding domain-containing radical SAM protein [Magnetococcales bacterium]